MSAAPARAIVFDLDGTLIDSKADIAAAVNHTLSAHGYERLPEATIATYVGDGARLLVARAARLAVADPRVGALWSTFVEYYTTHAVERTTLMPHAREALQALSAFPLALCTNKPRAMTDVVLERLFSGVNFRVVVAGGDLPANKPDPSCLYLIADKLGVRAESLVVVGDGHQDIDCAHAASALSIALTGGFTSEERLRACRPTAVVSSLLEVVAVVSDLTRPASDSPP
jgi:phosphoglycolate phosphatase